MKLPLLLADEAACPGRVQPGPWTAMTVPVCRGCHRLRNFDDAVMQRGMAPLNGVVPAAEWSDTRNEWQCANRLPMEG